MGETMGLMADADMLFSEYNEFIRNCRYISKEGVKLKILIFNGIISYYGMDDNEIYIEPAGEGDEPKVKIKRQLLKIFNSNDFEIRRSLLDGLSDDMLILIHEKKSNSIGYNSDTELSYEYAKTRVK
jgi:hypothetical protein